MEVLQSYIRPVVQASISLALLALLALLAFAGGAPI